MSLAALKEKIESDPAFAEKFSDIETVDEMVKIAGENGFELTAEEIEELSVVSSEDLARVAGGATVRVPVPVPIPIS